MATTEVKTISPENRKQWRAWLKKHHKKEPSVWLIFYKKSASRPTMSWSDAVDEALCFGWIDSVRKTVDEDRFIQFFSKRKPNSTWSKVNKEKVEKLVRAELMMPAGFQSIETAKQNGSWNLLDGVEELSIPLDLEKALEARPASKAFFLSLSRSAQKITLQWLMMAKREETRKKRIKEIVMRSGKKLKSGPLA